MVLEQPWTVLLSYPIVCMWCKNSLMLWLWEDQNYLHKNTIQKILPLENLVKIVKGSVTAGVKSNEKSD